MTLINDVRIEMILFLSRFVSPVFLFSAKGLARSHSDLVLPRFSHAILVFGGSVGLNDILQAEGNSDDASIKSPEVPYLLLLSLKLPCAVMLME